MLRTLLNAEHKDSKCLPRLYNTSQTEKYNLLCLFHRISKSLKRRGTDEAFCLLSSAHLQTSKITALLQGRTVRIYLYDLHTFTPVPTNHFSIRTANYHEKNRQRERHIKISVATTKRCSIPIDSALDSFTESCSTEVPEFSSDEFTKTVYACGICNDFRTALVTTVFL